jgi:hypothetical protein
MLHDDILYLIWIWNIHTAYCEPSATTGHIPAGEECDPLMVATSEEQPELRLKKVQ